MDAPQRVPTLVVVVGPAAVGKMTVGAQIARRTGFKLFHNHHSIEPILPVFHYGHPSFTRIVHTIRSAMFEEVAGSDLLGLVFTFMWAFDLPEDAALIESYAEPFRVRGGTVVFVELEASLDERIKRNTSAHRLEHKPSKRDIEGSGAWLLQAEQDHQLNSPPGFAERDDWIRIDNTSLQPEQVADLVIERFALPHE